MLLIKDVNLLSMDGADGTHRDILIGDDGRIADVGANLNGADTKVIVGTGLYAVPGFIDAHTHIGMFEDGMRREGSDGNEVTDPITPHLSAVDAINPFDKCFGEALAAGVTTVCTGPGSANVIGGQFALLRTWGGDVEDKLITSDITMKSAFGENPKFCYGDHDKSPSTRMAVAAEFRQAFIAAQEYMKKKDDPDPAKHPDYNMKHEALIRVLKREIPIKCHAHRADDIATAIRVCREFNLRFTLDHCTEGYMITDTLKHSGAEGIIIGPLFSDRSKIELRNLSYSAPKALYEAGIPFAMMTDHPVIPQQYLPVSAAIAVREGLPEEEGLKSITINAAKILGIEARKGSITPGKDADIALLDGHPFDFRARVKLVVAGGKIVHE